MHHNDEFEVILQQNIHKMLTKCSQNVHKMLTKPVARHSSHVQVLPVTTRGWVASYLLLHSTRGCFTRSSCHHTRQRKEPRLQNGDLPPAGHPARTVELSSPPN